MREEKNISVVIGESEDETRVPLIFQVVVELVIGVFLIIYRDMTTNVLFIVIGALMVCYGVFDLIAFVTNNRNYSFRRGLTTSFEVRESALISRRYGGPGFFILLLY